MLFWVGILVGGLFAWLAVRLGFYETWAMLFNIVVSIYLSVFLGPILIDIVPGAADTAYSNVLAMACTAAGVFLILHCISYTFLTGQFSVTFPRIFNSLGAALLGFAAGFLVWSFLSILICITPLAEKPMVRGLGFDRDSQQSTLSNICWWCDLVHGAVSTEEKKVSSKEAIGELLKHTEEQRVKKRGEQGEPNKPNWADADNAN